MPKPTLRTRLIRYAEAEAKKRGLRSQSARETVTEALASGPRGLRRRDPKALRSFIEGRLEENARARNLSASIRINRGTWSDEQTDKVHRALEQAGFSEVSVRVTSQYVHISMDFMTTEQQAKCNAIQAIRTVTLGSPDWYLEAGDGLMYLSTTARVYRRQSKPVLA